MARQHGEQRCGGWKEVEEEEKEEEQESG